MIGPREIKRTEDYKQAAEEFLEAAMQEGYAILALGKRDYVNMKYHSDDDCIPMVLVGIHDDGKVGRLTPEQPGVILIDISAEADHDKLIIRRSQMVDWCISFGEAMIPEEAPITPEYYTIFSGSKEIWEWIQANASIEDIFDADEWSEGGFTL